MSAIKSMMLAVQSAVDVHLSPIQISTPSSNSSARPEESDCTIFQFPTDPHALDEVIGDLFGRKLTTSYTTVVIGNVNRDACVYVHGRFAYRVKKPNTVFYDHLKNQILENAEKAHLYES